MDQKKVNTLCFECHSRCGVIIDVEDNRMVGIKGDKSHPFSHGFLCPKAKFCNELIYHPDRITTPLVRTGEKGSGEFEKVSWDHALSIIAEKMLQAREDNGPESVVFGHGTTRGLSPYLYRFVGIFGSPNIMAPLNYSGGPIVMGGAMTAGFPMTEPDFSKSKNIVLWGTNPDASMPGRFLHEINQGLKAGAVLTVVDPRGTRLARKADHWLQIRPGTDTALILGFLNVIISKCLYDRAFVEEWTVGFEQLKEHVSDFTPERCAEITRVPAEQIERAATAFAESLPAGILPGLGCASQQNDAFDMNRALTMLSAITGNLDVPGGNLNVIPPTGDRFCYGKDWYFLNNLPASQVQKKIGSDRFPLISLMGMPSPSETVWPVILEQKPYPVNVVGLFASNPMCAYGNSPLVKKALTALDFLFVVDYFHTPTTAMADVVLPPAHWTERDDMEDLLMEPYLFCQPKALEPIPECRDEKQILVDLAQKIGMEGYFGSVQEMLDYRLEPLGVTFEEFKQKRVLETPVEYRKYEKMNGFETPSRKVELYSQAIIELGADPMPVFREPEEGPVTHPELLKEFPLALTTGGRHIAFYHSAHRNIKSLRKLAPDPELQIHPETAKNLNISDGEWVYVASPRARVEAKAALFEGIHPNVVHLPHGYWYGETDGWRRFNVNMITDNEPLCPVSAGAPVKSLLCRVEKMK
jgi:anaerobic selenocysteine-containing dehydrogenase